MEHRVTLQHEEVEAIRELLDELAARYDSTESAEFQDAAPLAAQELPLRLRRAFAEFKLREPASVMIVSGWPVDQEAIGPTPPHWNRRQGVSRALREEMLLVLYGELLGEAIAWSTQQNGYLVHDILPIEGHQHEQLGSGSEEPLTWHTEDAFHPCRGDYLGMLCLRNPDRVPTTVFFGEHLDLPEDQVRVLMQPRFRIRPDESHLPKNRSGDQDLDPVLARAYARIEQMNTRPEKIPVLSGDPARPYLRLDPYFMDRLDEDPEAQAALDAMTAQIDEKIGDLVLEAGDFCFIDNFRAVHGRKPFKARFDGTDRWMKRINVTRDLRKSREMRRTPESRVIL